MLQDSDFVFSSRGLIWIKHLEMASKRQLLLRIISHGSVVSLDIYIWQGQKDSISSVYCGLSKESDKKNDVAGICPIHTELWYRRCFVRVVLSSWKMSETGFVSSQNCGDANSQRVLSRCGSRFCRLWCCGGASVSTGWLFGHSQMWVWGPWLSLHVRAYAIWHECIYPTAGLLFLHSLVELG